MYGLEHIREMARLKLELDPAGQLGRGNLLGEELLDAMAGLSAEPGLDEKGGECA